MAKDYIHQAVKQALINDGWTITDDPLKINLYKDERHYEVDLGAEKIIGAIKGVEKIAVEVKSLVRRSLLNEFHGVLGQYLTYLVGLKKADMAERVLYLGISEDAYNRVKKIDILTTLIDTYHVKLLIVDVEQEKIVQWIK